MVAGQMGGDGRAVYRLKRKYGDGPAKLIHLFDPEGEPPLAASTAGEILKRHGMVRPRKPAN